MREKTQSTFFSGVLLLTLSTVSVKIIGLIYKIPMLAYLGSEGMGYFNSAYEIYALFCVISTAGLPVALSVLISGAVARGNNEHVARIYRASMMIFLCIGVIGSGAMVVFAKQFCNLIQSENAYYSILSIAPTVFLICISSGFRGFFQGYQKMLPTAISQILESLGKLIFGLWFASIALNKGYDTPIVAAYAGLGLTLGTLLSVAYLAIKKARFHPHRESTRSKTRLPSYRSLWKMLAGLAIPMTIGASLVSITKLIDMTMILRQLQAIGYSEELANKAYGSYTTLSLSVFALLPTLLNSVALPLIPILSGAIAAGEVDRQRLLIRTTYRLTAIFSIPAALGIAAFAKPVLQLLFGHDPEAVTLAAPLLSYLGVSVFLSCMITATNSILHAYQIVNRPIFSMLAGAVAKIVAAYFLIGNPKIGLFGAPISTFLCNFTVVTLNLCFAAKLCDLPDLFSFFLRPLAASACAVGAGWIGYQYLTSQFGEKLLFAVICMALILFLYLIFACLMKCIRAEDLDALPMGAFLCRILLKLHLVKPHITPYGKDVKNENETNRSDQTIDGTINL